MDNLEGNSKRQAVPTLKGYAYQIWQSLFMWTSLKQDEYIFLEGAEDIDLLKKDVAESVQVKATSSQVTLGLKSTAEILNNFWENKLKNPRFLIKYRYLTTSERGFEQGDPFSGKKGLDVWDSCKFPGTDISLLRKFLKSSVNFSPALQSFINSASDDELRTELIIPVEWDTGSFSLEIIEQLVEGKIVNYGDRIYDLPPHTSKTTIPHLLKHVWDVVCRNEDRWLQYQDFLKIFEKSTMELVPRKELRELNRTTAAASPISGILGFGAPLPGAAFAANPDIFLEKFNPPEMMHFADRSQIVKDLKDRLNNTGILMLIGSTGMGKSILSYQLAGITEGNWRKLDLRGNSPEQINEKLLFASSLITNYSERIDLVIDDLNFDQRPHIYENALIKLIFLLKFRNGRIVITSHHRLPARVEAALDVRKESSFSVPRLDETEIKNLLIKHACPPGHKLEYWSKVINLRSQRHPTLCHAWVRKAAEDNWKELSIDDIFNAPLNDIREESRRMISEQLADETRLLLYRLTIFIGRFKRKQALVLGKSDPSIRFPGEEFDRLIGPWVEPVGNNYFRISPLVRGIENAHFLEEEIKEFHKTVAKSYLDEVIGYVELDGLLWHGFFGEENKALVGAVMSLNGVDSGTLTSIYQYIDWFMPFNVENGQKLYPKNNFLNYLLRQLQFDIAEELKPRHAVKIAELIERELEDWTEEKEEDRVSSKPSVILVFLTKTLLCVNVPFPLKQAFNRTLQLIELIEDNNFFPSHPEYQRQFETKADKLLDPRYFIYPLPIRCKTPESVIELLTLIEEAGLADSHPIRQLFSGNGFIAGLLVDVIWLRESEKDSPNWDSALESLDWVIEYSLRNNTETFGVAAFIGKAIVYQEYLKDTDKALQTLDEGEKLYGYSNLLLEDYRAKVFYYQKDYEAAFNLWKTVLPQISNDPAVSRSTSFREAQICAERMGNWNEASKFALMGEQASRFDWFDNEIIKERGNKPFDLVTLEYKADYALAEWKAGNKETAVGEFFRITKRFNDIPDPQENIKVNIFYKRVGHTIGWMSMETKSPEGASNEVKFHEPPAGVFSNPEITDEIKDEVSNSPFQPITNLMYLLASLEYRLDLGDEIFKEFEGFVSNEGGININLGFNSLLIKHALRDLKVENLINQVVNYSKVMSDYLKLVEHNPANFELEEILKSFLLAALINAVAQNNTNLLPLDIWKDDLSSCFPENASIFNFLDFIKETEDLSTGELANCLQNTAEPPDKRLIAAVRLSNVKLLDPNTRFFSNVVLLISGYLTSIKEEISLSIERMIAEAWTGVVKTQRFYINSPNYYAPKILSVCNDNSANGISKAAKILIEVRNAVSVPVSNSVLENLQKLSLEDN